LMYIIIYMIVFVGTVRQQGGCPQWDRATVVGVLSGD
jgi:hypothetical protein